ncbi:unnamed protein product [Echinostoma caproni]|uniref:Uncharacterized protein n=1 Tax=Echinostoma caproni TaxID=27848 RepID=A0A3P8HPX5_9TREM|nr:unnamed protein product [Echinostoma caproni]
MVELILDYLFREVNVPAGPCTHVRRQQSALPSETLSTSPLGLACRLADSDENLACRLTSLLLASGAFDPEQTLFYHAFQRHHLRLAGLLLTGQSTRTVSSGFQCRIGMHVNLSHKRLDRNYVPGALWLLRHGPLTDWLNGDCHVPRTAHPNPIASGPTVPRMISHSFAHYPITRVSLSHCGLQLFPWCVLGDLPNLEVCLRLTPV